MYRQMCSHSQSYLTANIHILPELALQDISSQPPPGRSSGISSSGKPLRAPSPHRPAGVALLSLPCDCCIRQSSWRAGPTGGVLWWKCISNSKRAICNLSPPRLFVSLQRPCFKFGFSTVFCVVTLSVFPALTCNLTVCGPWTFNQHVDQSKPAAATRRVCSWPVPLPPCTSKGEAPRPR